MKKNPNLDFSRYLYNILTATLFCSFACQSVICQANQTYDIVHQVEANKTYNIKSQVQYIGSVIVDRAGEENDQKVLPLDVRGRFNFDERISSGSVTTPQAIRYFEMAEASIKAGKGKTTTRLDESNRLVLARMKDSAEGTHHFQIASIAGALKQKEYELLKNPGDPLAFSDLFQKKDVEVGDKWKVKKEQIIGLLNTNRLISSSMNMMLKSVDQNIAKIYVYGAVKGEVDDAITDLKIKAIAQLDLDQQLVTAFRMSINEERRAGQIAPGFEGQIKLDTKIQPTSENLMLSKSRIAELYKGKKVKFSFLFDRPENDFQLFYNTKWRVIASEEDAAVLRYIDDSQMIAQCNVVQLPKRPADNPLPLSKFQEEVRRIISEADARIVDSDRFTSDKGYEVLKVAVDGKESDIPFSWLYYHVSAEDGRRVTFVFTLEKDVEDYLGTADRSLVRSIVFKASREAKATTETTESR